MKRILLTLIITVFFSCNEQRPKSQVQKSEKLTVITVNYPLYYFADRIGGDLLNLQYPVPEGLDPAYWKPDEEALNSYQTADLILANGVNYAKWMENVSLPSSRIINTSDAFEKDLIPLSAGAAHSHGPEGEHEHAGYAFTTWLDLDLALKQAEAIKVSFTKKRPDQKQAFEEAFGKLKTDLSSLQQEMKKVTASYQDEVILASHPVYQYLSSAYSLKLKSVHFEPDEFPSSDQWEVLDALIRENGCNLMIWEDTPMEKIKVELEQRNIRSIIFRPCGNAPTHGDFLSIMRENINNFKNK